MAVEWLHWKRNVAIGVAVAIIAGICFYAILRFRVTYQLESDNAKLSSQITELAARQEALHKSVNERLDLLEAFLYGSIVPSLQDESRAKTQETRRSNLPAIWQKNRDRELRERIQQLEQWRLEMMQKYPHDR